MTQRSYYPGVKVFFIFIGLYLLVPPYGALPCTLFGAIGDSVDGGGVLIGKTRDRPNKLEQAFIEVSPSAGFRYRGIAAMGTKTVTSGINEKGVVVVNAMASSLGKEDKITSVGRILSRVSAVDEVVALVKKGEVHGPVFYLAGDSHQLALIEVIDGRRHAIQVKKDGILYHTNHFVLKDMEKLNQKIGTSSQARLNRIGKLLSDGSVTKDKFITFVQDHYNGPGNNSICRHFEAEVRSSEQTVSAAVYYLPKAALPEIWVSLGQPCQSVFERK